MTVLSAGSRRAANWASLPPSTKERAPLASWLGMQILLLFPAARIAVMQAWATGYQSCDGVVGSFWMPNQTLGLSRKIVASFPHRSASTAPSSWAAVGFML